MIAARLSFLGISFVTVAFLAMPIFETAARIVA
jgi:hypothetical protein